jgi:hypothetical protein
MDMELQRDFSTDKLAFDDYQAKGEGDFDSTADRMADHVADQAARHSGPIPTDRGALCKVVAAIVKSALTVEAISGLMMQFLAEDIRTIKIKVVQAVLHLVKSEKPHLTIDVIEHVFGFSKKKESDIARDHGIDRQVVSKRVVKMRKAFGLQTARHDETSGTYRDNRLSQYEQARDKIRLIRLNNGTHNNGTQ